MKGPHGYGRYDDDPGYVGCPRAKTDMTPCIARDGHLALASDGKCVGCGSRPDLLIAEIGGEDLSGAPEDQADRLTDLVRRLTEPLMEPEV
jgi:hypothetical protein